MTYFPEYVIHILPQQPYETHFRINKQTKKLRQIYWCHVRQTTGNLVKYLKFYRITSKFRDHEAKI